MRLLYYGFHVLLLPILALALMLYRLRIISFATGSRFMALLPGEPARFIRSRWYRCTLERCGERLYVDWMAVILYPETHIGHDVLIGTRSSIGLSAIGDDVLIANDVVILSGKNHHYYDRRDIPIRLQGGERHRVQIGRDVWLGARTIITADVAEGSVVGAGALVTKTYEPYQVLVGFPAKPVAVRGDTLSDDHQSGEQS